jgi:hypothetical protein
MATGRSVTKDDLKKHLKSRINQYQMLNNSLLEMFERDSSTKAINEMRNAMNETADDIKNLQRLIEEKEQDERHKKSVEEKKVEYSFYNGLKKKPRLAKSVKLSSDKVCCGRNNLYDSIKKDDKKTAANLGDFKPYDTPYNKLNYEDVYKQENVGKEQIDISAITNSNLFLVKFGDALNIREWMVKSVYFAPSDRKEFIITIQDHIVTREDGTKYPIISELMNKKGRYDSRFPITIDYLDKTGVLLYRERYHGCVITDVIKGDLSYSKDEFSTIEFTVNFSEITYETSH